MAGGQLAALRRRRFMTQTELAERIGVSMKTVQAWEGGRAQPRLRHIPKLAEALDVPAEQLVEIFEGKAAA
jgi:transcriptional regulator with XRE-family HTH domain